MHMGALVTVGAVKPDNLTVLLIQNGVHAASGGQALTNPALDLAQLARSAGIARAQNIATPDAFASALAAAERPARPGAVDRARPRSRAAADRIRSGADQTPLQAAIGTPRYIPTLFGGGKFEAT